MDSDDPVLLVGADVRTLDPATPRARAVLVKRRRIAWIGQDPAEAPAAHVRTMDLTGTTLIPAFVNAHTHLTRLGLTLNAMDLSGAASLAECLSALEAIATVTPHPVVWAGGWDETNWPEQRAPNAEELSAAGADRPIMLTRSDGHCVVVDRISLTTLPIARARGVERGPDGRATGVLRQEAAQVAQRWFTAEMPRTVLASARSAVADRLATLGVASAHEMGGPHRMGPDDFVAWVHGHWPLEVVGYWGDMDLEFVTDLGLRRVGGSLLLDGTIGSHSAALRESYADRAGAGQLYRDTTELISFALQATHRGIQVALHAIGDRAVEQAITVFEAVATEVGEDQVRRLGHRIEYAALMGGDQMARLTDLGILVTIQPATDLDLGQAGGAYERRLGARRARRSNPLRSIADAGIRIAFGSDSVEHLDPWTAIRAALQPRGGMPGLTLEQALRAATLGGRAAAHQPNVGLLRAGHRADLAAFEGFLEPSAEGELPGDPRCVMTMVAGRTTHDRGAWVSAEQELIACDTALAMLLGVPRDRAAAAAAHAAAAQPDLGLLTMGAVAAARWGVDVVPAIGRLADGEVLRGALSDYEKRFGAEEAGDELDRALDGLAVVTRPGGVHVGPPDAEVAAVEAVLAGVDTLSLELITAPGVAARVEALAARLGIDITDRAGELAEVGDLDPAGSGSAYVGFGEIRSS